LPGVGSFTRLWRELAVLPAFGGSWQLSVISHQLAVGGWQLAVGSFSAFGLLCSYNEHSIKTED
jgi:translation initiation factor 6 (eIF-6)